MGEPAVVVLGEALVDVLHRSDGRVARVPGGSGANTALALARLGMATTLSTCLGADDDGRLITDRLRGSGVDLVVEPVARTSTARALLGEGGAADYTFDVEWDPAPELPSGLDHLHVGSFSVVLEPGASTVHRLAGGLSRLGEVGRPGEVGQRATISYDVNLRPTMTGTGPEVVTAVRAMLARADVVKLSDEDLEALAPGVPLDEAVAGMLAAGPVAVVLTRGPAGASWFGVAGRVDVPAVPAVLADTIGAGDTFSAGMLSALAAKGALGPVGRARLRALGPDDWRDVLDLAARAAAVTVSRQGADPPYPSEL